MLFEGGRQDLTHGARMLLKNPGFALVAMISIAIGVGVNAAMFSVADGLVLRPLQVPRAGEIVALTTTSPRASASFISGSLMSYRDYVDLRDLAQSYKGGVVAYGTTMASFTPRLNEPAQTRLGLFVSGNFFDGLELQPAVGRFFRPDEDRVPGRDAVIVLAHELWTEQFGRDPGVVGRTVRVAGTDLTVIGVAPASFPGVHLVLRPGYFVPIAMSPALSGPLPVTLERRDVRVLNVKGRLKPGVSLEQARQEAALIARGLEQTYPDTNRQVGMLVRSDFDFRLEERGPSAPSAFMLLVLAFVVLLVACANVAGLLMSRAPAREQEIALRMAIGGGRARVTRQLLTESCLLAVGGGLLGLAFGYAVVAFFQQLPLVSDIGLRLTFELDRRAVTVGVVLAALSAILSSLLPAWRATRTADLTGTMRSGARGITQASRLWGRNGLVTAQVALSLILLTVTVFLGGAFQAELRTPGFRTEQLLLANLEPRLAGYDGGRMDAFYRELTERARGIGGVTSVGMTSVMPLNQDYRDPVTAVPEGYQLPRGTESVAVLTSRIDEGFLDTMQVPLLRGRGILRSDIATSPRVALVNQAMAARYWPDQDPIGKRVHLLSRNGQPWVEVVGVTADSKYNWIGEAPTPWMYLAQRQDVGARSTLILASSGDPAGLAAPLRDIVRDIDPDMPLTSVRTMEEFYYGNAVAIVATLIAVTGGMGTLGLALAAVGLYGLVAYSAARRTREIGIRMAVGARPGAVMQMVLRHGLMLAAFGVALGVLGSIATGGLLRSVFPNVGSINLGTYLLVVPALVAVTLVAAYFPARRASRIDPLQALRTEQ